MGRVVVLGSINRDLVVRVAHLPRPGETVSGSSFAEFPGGKGANQAVAARRMGANVALVGAVGRDGFGEAMRAFLKAELIDLSALAVLEVVPTGIAMIGVEQSGENAIIVVAGANAAVKASQIDWVSLHTGDILVSQFEVPPGEIIAAFEKGRAKGVTTVLNPAPIQDIPTELLALCDFIVFNETELASTCDQNVVHVEDAEAAMQVLRARPSCDHLTLITTLGKDGCLAIGPMGRHRIEGINVNAVDTTGAGDCFVGALAAGLSEGMPLEAALKRANIAASLSVTRPGAAASMPYRPEVK